MLGACSTTYTHSKIKVEENGKKAVFCNESRRAIAKVQFDGCVRKNAEACDYIVIDESIGYVLVELKGKDVEKALAQINSSVDFIQKNKVLSGKFGALIVCSGVKRSPAFTTLHQRLKSEFAKKYKAPIFIVNGEYEYSIENLISFKNPIV